MKPIKGKAGYLKQQLKREWIKLGVEAGVIVGLLLLGYATTKTRLNMLTLVAVLGCLPAAKTLVGIIMRLPHKSIPEEETQQIQQQAEGLPVLYDLVLTSEDHVMPVDCLVYTEHVICGYTRSEKADIPYTEAHIRRILLGNGIDQVTVKFFKDFDAFLNRCKELQKFAEEGRNESKRALEIRQILLNISL